MAKGWVQLQTMKRSCRKPLVVILLCLVVVLFILERWSTRLGDNKSQYSVRLRSHSASTHQGQIREREEAGHDASRDLNYPPSHSYVQIKDFMAQVQSKPPPIPFPAPLAKASIEELMDQNHIPNPSERKELPNSVLDSRHPHQRNDQPVTILKMRNRFPRVMIVGFGKTGTKALFEAMKMHPDLVGPQREKRFFSDKYGKGLWSYLQSLPEPSPGQWVIEKSPDYIINEPVPSRILTSITKLGLKVQEIKFIVVLRDPIDRAMSEYLEWKEARKGNLPPFHSMSTRKRDDGQLEVNAEQPFIKSSNYTLYIRRWLEYFSRNQTCFVDGDKFTKDPYSEIHLLEECLGLRTFFTRDNFVFNSQRGFYCFKSSLHVQGLPLMCMNPSKGRKHPHIPAMAYEVLKRHFLPLNSELPRLTGKAMEWQEQGEGE